MYFTPLAYRALGFLRRWAYDLLALIPLLVAGGWWIVVSSGTDVPLGSVDTADGLQVFLLSHHASRFYPTVIALLLCVIILRFNRTVVSRESPVGVHVTTRFPLGIAALLAVLAVLDLILVPGPLVERALPCVVAAAWGWLIRSVVYGRVRVLEQTGAGFRPPAHVAFSRRARRFTAACLTATWRGQRSPVRVRAGLNAAIAHFSGGRDAAVLAWCMARAVDYNLSVGALDEAETILGLTERHPELSGQPSLHAARGLFGRAIGSHDAGADLAQAERICRGIHRRVPWRLRTLLTEYEMPWPADSGTRRRSGRARVLLAWNRSYAAVIQDVLLQTFPLQRRDPELAIALTERLRDVVDDLGRESTRADLDPDEVRSVHLAKAAAWERTGDILAGQERFREAARAYRAAADLYREFKHRPRAGFAAVRASVLALRGGLAIGDEAGESALLTALLTGLQAMEYDRGRLRQGEHRSLLLAAREALYSEVFTALAESVTTQHSKAAEIALWLLESVHRNALAETIQYRQETNRPERSLAGNAEAPAAEALRRLREPVDVARIRQAISGRAALYYRCEKADGSWRITTVLATPTGLTLHRAKLPAVAPGTGQITAMRQPAGLLDALASDDEEAVTTAHQDIRLDMRPWTGLAAAVLPPGLAPALRALARGEDPAILLLVPDGPLSAVPFPGLRFGDGTQLADLAAVVFMPNLLSFSSRDWDSMPGEAGCVAVTHFGITKFSDAFEELRTAPRNAGARLIVRATTDRAALLSALTTPPAPRIVLISQHGKTAINPADRYISIEGGALSESDARRIIWPQTVVLGSCWASQITVRAGEDPVGLPTACLLGGARAVLGGQSVVDDDEVAAGILARVTLDAARGRHPALGLRAAVMAHLAATPADRSAPPAQWANLSVWTSRPPAGMATDGPTWVPSTAVPQADMADFTPLDAVFSGTAARRRKTQPRYIAVQAGQSLRRAVRQARQRGGPFITTPDLFAAIIETDGADWISFITAAVLPANPPPQASRENTAPATVLALDLDSRIAVSRAVGDAFGRAERLAAHLHEPELTPAHVVYGFLSDRTCDATRWLTAGGCDRDELLTLLGDRLFAMDLLPSSILGPVVGEPRGTAPALARRPHGPAPSRELLALLTAASSGTGHAALTTLDFCGAADSAGQPGWRQLTAAGFRLTPPGTGRFPERDRGGQRIRLGDGYSPTVTADFADAYQAAAALAWYLGDTEITPAHVLYGILTAHDNDAARWLRPAADDGEGPVAVLAAQVFRRPLPAPARLGAPAAPREPGSVLAGLLVPVSIGSKLVRRIPRKMGQLAFGALFLLIVIVTMALADINTAVPNITQLDAGQRAITATLRTGQRDGTTLPATLVGSLSSFYVQPVILGWQNQLREAIFGSGSPASLSGLYLFAVPPPPHAPPSATGWLGYENGSYPARITCQGQLARTLCLAVARLPASVSPGGFSWVAEYIHGGVANGEVPQGALVYTTAGHRGGAEQADLRILQLFAAGDLLAVQDRSGHAIRPGSPVVLAGRSRGLPLLGLAVPSPHHAWDLVYPVDLMEAYAQGIADRLAGPAPGAVAYAGLIVGNTSASASLPGPAIVSEVSTGSPADDAGFQVGDQILDIGGAEVTAPIDVPALIAQHRPGQVVKVVIRRARTRITLTLTLGYAPVGAQDR